MAATTEPIHLPSWLDWLTPELIMLVVLGAVVLSSLLLWLYVFLIRRSQRAMHSDHDEIAGQLEEIGAAVDDVAQAVERLAEHHHIDGGPRDVEPQQVVVERAVPIQWTDPARTAAMGLDIVQHHDYGMDLFTYPDEDEAAQMGNAPAEDPTGEIPVPVGVRRVDALPEVPQAPVRKLSGSTRYRAPVQHLTSGPVTVPERIVGPDTAPDHTPQPPTTPPPVPYRRTRGRHARDDDE
jgi:outer membrane murein-binding lipoprotein Lpp